MFVVRRAFAYTRLEQQRGPQPSVQIATALARALRLTLDERDHLFGLIGHNAPARFHHSEHVSPTLLRVLDRLDDTPALVLSDLADVLAQNPLSAALTRDQTRHTGLARSAYYRWFTDPAERLFYPEEDLIVLTTRPGTESHTKLQLLAVIGHQQLTP